MKGSLKIIIPCVITAIVVGCISVFATSAYLASDITFTPSDSAWSVTNVEEAINDIHNKSNVTFETGVMNGATGVISFTIDKDCDHAMIISGQTELMYSINSTSDWKEVAALGPNTNGMGYYYANISVEKGDIVYLKQSTTGLFAYNLIY